MAKRTNRQWDGAVRQPISFTMNQWEYEDLEALAKETGLNASAMVRKLIEDGKMEAMIKRTQAACQARLAENKAETQKGE